MLKNARLPTRKTAFGDLDRPRIGVAAVAPYTDVNCASVALCAQNCDSQHIALTVAGFFAAVTSSRLALPSPLLRPWLSAVVHYEVCPRAYSSPRISLITVPLQHVTQGDVGDDAG